MDKSFEFLARKGRTPENPTKHLPAPVSNTFQPIIAIMVCIGIGMVLAYFTQDEVAKAFKPILRMKTLTPFYYHALVAYYTVASLIIYGAILLAEAYGIEACRYNDEIPSYGAVAISAATRAVMAGIFCLTFPFVLTDELALSRLQSVNYHLMLPAIVAVVWVYFFIPLSIYVTYKRNCQKG